MRSMCRRVRDGADREAMTEILDAVANWVSAIMA